jgi:hypothetical protein
MRGHLTVASRRTALGLVIVIVALLWGSPALAQQGPETTIPVFGSAQSCAPDNPTCYVGVGTPGSPGGNGNGNTSGDTTPEVVPVSNGVPSGGGNTPTGTTGGTQTGPAGGGRGCYVPLGSGGTGGGGPCAPEPPADSGCGLLSLSQDLTCTGPVAVAVDPAAPAAPPSGAQVARRALNSFTIPEPVVVRAPPGPSYVNFKTWLALADWTPVTATASLNGISSTITGVPQRAVWEMGPEADGTVVCDGPGQRYNPAIADELQSTDCGYTYRRSSAGIGVDNAYSAQVTVTYQVTWVSSDGTSGVVGPVSRTTVFPLRVAEIQAINTRP